MAQHWRRVLYPHSPLGLVARVQQHTRETKPLPVRPNQRPALSRVRESGSQTDPPWYNGRAGIIPFRYSPDLLGGKGTSHVGRDTGDLQSRGKKYGNRTPPGPCVPHGGSLGGWGGGKEAIVVKSSRTFQLMFPPSGRVDIPIRIVLIFPFRCKNQLIRS